MVGRWKELKLSGQIGSPGQKDKLTYSALSFQIESARTRGFSEPEIVAAVIRAITPGEDLRTYLEMTPNLTLVGLIQILRAHFKEKDATSVFNELSNGAQLPTEGENDFCLRMMGLRQKVLMLSAEEGGQYTQQLVQSQFQKSLSTGFRREAVRQQLRGLLKTVGLLDVVLLQELSEVVMMEAEHTSKSSTTKTSVNLVNTPKTTQQQQQQKNNPIIAEIAKLTTQVGQLTGLQSGMKTEIDNLRKSFQSGQQQQFMPAATPTGPLNVPPAAPPTSTGGRGAYTRAMGSGSAASRGTGRSRACPLCQQTNANGFCRHCFYCGADVNIHRYADCPTRLADEQKNLLGLQG